MGSPVSIPTPAEYRQIRNKMVDRIADQWEASIVEAMRKGEYKINKNAAMDLDIVKALQDRFAQAGWHLNSCGGVFSWSEKK